MATNAKGKKKSKGKTLDLHSFLGEDQDAPSGYAVVQPRRIDWADAMDNEDLDDRYTLDFKKEEKVVLPTAPKAARGPDFDVSKVPSNPPYTAFLGNLPYDVSEEDIMSFFRSLPVKNVRLPRDNGEKGRIRGFGYAEFNTRQDLIQALALNNETLKNRAIKISLAGEHDGDRDKRDAGPDRTLGDWRLDRKDQFSRDEMPRNDSYQSRGGFSDREPYRAKSSYDRPFERNERNDRPFERNDRNDRPFERNDRNDRGFERNGDRYERNDRDYGRDQDRSDRRGNDRGYGFSSDRGMNRSGGGGRNDRREGGFRDNYSRRDEGGYNRDSRYSSDRDPPRDNYERRPPSDQPSYDSGSGAKERPKLQLAPRTKPIEPVPPPAEAVKASSIFGGAKPVDTAAREREIEERLARENKDPPREKGDVEPRVRKFSSGSGISSRSRRSSDSNPPRDEEEHLPASKPPIPRQLEREGDEPYTQPRTRQRCGSTSSTGSDRENVASSKHNQTNNRKENGNNNYSGKNDNFEDGGRPHSDDGYSEPDGFKSVRGHSYRDNSKDRALRATTYEEPKPPVYACANKFSHLMNDGDDLDRDDSE